MQDQDADFPEELHAWTAVGDSAQSAETTVAEFLHDFKSWIDSGKVKVEQGNQKYFDLLESKYPIGLNRIERRGMREDFAIDILPADERETACDKHREKLSNCRRILTGGLDAGGIDLRDQVVLIGDAVDLSLHMTIETLLQIYPIIFSYSEHHYE